MAVELLEEHEEAPETFPRLAFTAPARDFEAEIAEARQDGWNQCAAALVEEYNAKLAERPPRAPLAVEMIPVLEKIAMLTGIRVMLFVALVATFALAWVAMGNPSVARLVLVGMFGAITLGPLAYLAHRRTG